MLQDTEIDIFSANKLVTDVIEMVKSDVVNVKLSFKRFLPMPVTLEHHCQY
jgi:hypothetical protein